MSPTTLVAVEHAQPARVGDLADRAWRAPPSARRPPRARPSRSGSTTHSIRSCDSETMISNGSMSSSRSGTRETSMSIPTSPFDAISDELERQARGAEVLERAQRAAVEQLEAALEQLLLLERVADLHASAAWTRPRPSSALRQHRRAADAVAPGARAQQHEQVAHARGGAADQPVLARDAQAHGVDQAVLLVGALEVDLAAHGGHADRVAVVADARHRAVEQVARAAPSRARRSAASRAPRSAARRPRRRRAGCRRRPVAAPWNGSTALGWLCDSTLNATASPSPTSTAPAFSPGPISTCGPSVGSLREQLLRVLVGAVLGPHQREHGQLDAVRLAAELLARSARTRRR